MLREEGDCVLMDCSKQNKLSSHGISSKVMHSFAVLLQKPCQVLRVHASQRFHEEKDTVTVNVVCTNDIFLQASASSRASVMSPSPASGTEMTEDTLAEREDEGAASIVEVYAALLLGFLLAEDSALQDAAIKSLGSLRPVLSAIEKCLSFYVNAGAIMSQNEESLKKLLTSLRGDALEV